ncbi:MAG: sugar transferase [Gorillibacterium sp.]|nr:sugar transferase [Gorillibacterium sp.]
MKRMLDIFFAICILFLCSPIILITGLLVRVNMGKPIFFRQQRPGLHGHLFMLYKFRTMREEHSATGIPLADGLRLTALGKVLRQTSMDELPQLLNILKGEMSFVGPRPLLVKYLAHYTPREQLRHRVRPGLTGLAQVNGRNQLHWSERLELDVCYVEQQSLLLDLKIIGLTLIAVLKRRGVVLDPGTLLLDLDVERMSGSQSAKS